MITHFKSICKLFGDIFKEIDGVISEGDISTQQDIVQDIDYIKNSLDGIKDVFTKLSNSCVETLKAGKSWGELSDAQEKREQIVEKTVAMLENMSKMAPNVVKKEFGSYEGVEIPMIKIPIVEKFEDIPEALYAVTEDDDNGIYLNLFGGVVKIPFPNLLDGTKSMARAGSICCKYIDFDKCKNARENLAAKFGSPLRDCNFAHQGEQYMRIGTLFRCPDNPLLGSHETFSKDIRSCNLHDIKLLLMNSLSDLLISAIWQYHHKKIKILKNVDIC